MNERENHSRIHNIRAKKPRFGRQEGKELMTEFSFFGRVTRFLTVEYVTGRTGFDIFASDLISVLSNIPPLL